MKRTVFTVIMVAASLGCAANANALPARTFVSVGGDDGNDCTLPTPCRTFDGAVSKTSKGGEITALDSGTYAAVTINKSLTIQAAPGVAAQLSRVTINGDPSANVILRNLEISHLPTRKGIPDRGVDFKAGAVLHVENCILNGFSEAGIAFNSDTGLCNSDGCPKLFMKDVTSRNNANGLFVAGAILSIDHCRFENNSNDGISINPQTTGTIRECVIAGNKFVGVKAGPEANISVEHCGITNNGAGISSSGAQGLGSIVYVSNSMIAGNQEGLNTGLGGQIISFANNQLGNNSTNGAFTGTIVQQ